VLARVNRLVTADDYRRLVRRGRRITTRHVVIYLNSTVGDESPRFGFIVAKSVGVAVSRNLVRRRLKAMSFERLASFEPGTEIVIRALPGSAQVDWDILRSEVYRALDGAKG
jgi:ribonuclease P protein component